MGWLKSEGMEKPLSANGVVSAKNKIISFYGVWNLLAQPDFNMSLIEKEEESFAWVTS